jgi:hypothetical protein
MPHMTANQFEKYCMLLRDMLWDDDACITAITNACNLLGQVLENNFDRERTKDSTLQDKAKALILRA